MNSNPYFASWRALEAEETAWQRACAVSPGAEYRHTLLHRRACRRDAEEGDVVAIALMERFTAELVALKLRS